MTSLSDKDLLEANAHIHTEEVRQDIADTKTEINRLQTGRAVSMSVSPRLRVGYAAAIRERVKFVEDLERLLRFREAA